MRILQFTATTSPSIYQGSCLLDNAHASELIRQGHEVTLVPLFSTPRTDETSAAQTRVFFRSNPLDRYWPPASGSPQKRAAALLRGSSGELKKEFTKLADWLSRQPPPDLAILPSALLISLAEPIKRIFNCPVCCRLQGEDLFLESLPEPSRTECLNLIRRQTLQIDRFLSTSRFYARLMSSYFDIPKSLLEVHPPGINIAGGEAQPRVDPPKSPKTPIKIGYFARICPEKGLHILAEAVAILTREFPNLEMSAAGSLAPEHRTYLTECHRMATFVYQGQLTRACKFDFLRSIDLTCVPSPYADPKGLYALESLAVGTPIAAPAHGVFPEIVDAIGGGGILYPRSDPRDIALQLAELIRRPARLREFGDSAAPQVRRLYSIEASVRRAVETYTALIKSER
ncbi:MAG TPA: glycosyltransferase family 4 protein [Bryobacteraceae bacterium]|jgi:glycosyltransferase involved in cell wall biosynthesis